jgi:uncharacterized protein (DUF1015 family)
VAEIHPFQGVHYDPSVVKDLSKVICPPYDIIPPQLQQQLYQRSEHNFIRVEFTRELPQDKEGDNKYTRASTTLEKWLEEGILTVDKHPAVYVDDHSFKFKGKQYRRRSITCLVKLEEWDKGIIRPHEGTLSRAKSDRLNLLWALQADTSPIMSLYEDTGKDIAALLASQTTDKPILDTADWEGNRHKVWAITDRKTNERLRDYLAGQSLYIADGHHRYESALNYRRQRRTGQETFSENEPFDYVMMTLIDFNDPGLVILPAHRLVRGLPPSAMEKLRDDLKVCFSIDEYPLNESDVTNQITGMLSGKKDEVIRIVLFGLDKKKIFRLLLNDTGIIAPMMPLFHSEIYRKLDVSIVDHVIIEEFLGLSHDSAGALIDYTNDATEAIRRVKDQEYQLALIINPVKPVYIKSIADSGDRMPRKSTYFFPKIPAGLLLYRFK